MKFVVRADASHTLGTGHIMRCLTLLDAAEVSAVFVCKDLPGHLGDLIVTRGYHLQLLDAGVSLSQDAYATAAVAQDADLVIVDNYGLDAEWEVQMPCSVMVIDDLANRPHDCRLLLDQNLGRQTSDYVSLLPPHARSLVGPKYALLRPEFAAARAIALIKREKKTDSLRILIAMGGTDAPNATNWVLSVLEQMSLPAGLQVTVVLGATAPHVDSVGTSLAELSCESRLLVGTNRMGSLMEQSDLAVGAAGSTSWERCALGLPTIVVVIADNQIEGAAALSAVGAASSVTFHENQALRLALEDLLYQDPVRIAMAQTAAAICDGRGAQRVTRILKDVVWPK